MRLLNTILCVMLAFGLMGCDQVRQKVADTLAAPSPTEMVARMDALINSSKAAEAVEQGRDYLKSNKDPQGIVKEALSRAYFEAGDAVSASNLKATSTDQIAPNQGAKINEPGAPTDPQPVNSVAVDGASVTSGPNGTVVRAGNAVVVMPK